jgi:sensor histidine kinase regulating citrate/malate metabolism
VIAFAYVALTIIVALTIPLAVTLDHRARAEFERENLIRANTIAQDVGAENLAPAQRDALQTIVRRAGVQVAGRVIVVDAAGKLLADSLGPATGEPYATMGRPEIVAALADQPTSAIRHSQDLGSDIMATAVPIVDERPGAAAGVVGAVRITLSMDVVNQNVRRVTLGVLAIGVGGLAVRVARAPTPPPRRRRPTVRFTRPDGTRRRDQRSRRGRSARGLVRSDGRSRRDERAGPRGIRGERLAPASNTADRCEAPSRVGDRR